LTDLSLNFDSFAPVERSSAALFRPIRTRRTFEEAVEQIADAISSQKLRPGDRLPSERVLADVMGIGRPTIREAFKKLTDAGVIEMVGRGRSGGAYVRSDLLPAGLIEDRTSLRVSEVGGVLVARRVLEPRMAQLAAFQRTDEDVERLDRLLVMQREALGDRTRFLDIDLRFHLEIARCTHNATLEALAKTLVRRVEKAYDLALRDPQELSWKAAQAEHQQIVKAITGRDPQQADLAMSRHLRLLEEMWEKESGYSFHRKLPDFLDVSEGDAAGAG
jgi:GntR family transcriptional repressor for pyruvate dehydrogenase complex